MPDTLSTLEVPVRWVNEIREVHQRKDTRFFLFSQEVGHLLVQEPIKGESDSEAEPSATTHPTSTERKTTHSRSQDVRVPRARRMSTRPDDRYILLKKYEGFVTSRGERSFTARLFENVCDYPVVEAEFDMEELSETDRGLAVEGAALVWTIGYGYEGSTRKRESTIYLRRLPPWSEMEIEQGKQMAAELTSGIQWK